MTKPIKDWLKPLTLDERRKNFPSLVVMSILLAILGGIAAFFLTVAVLKWVSVGVMVLFPIIIVTEYLVLFKFKNWENDKIESLVAKEKEKLKEQTY